MRASARSTCTFPTEFCPTSAHVAATRWPDRETVTDASQGVQLATMQKLAQYWANNYDWRKCEAKLNALPMFVTNIDGLKSSSSTSAPKTQRLARHHHARLARVDHRRAQSHRPPD